MYSDVLLYDRNIMGPSSEIFGYLRKSSVIFGKCSETFVKPSEQFWKIFGNLRKVVGNLPKIVKNVVISMFIYALGIHFSYDLKRANTLNFEEKVCSLEKTLNNWKKRKLTLISKINIVKTLDLSKLIYCSSLLTVSKSLIDRINNIIFSFIWEGKPPKIKKKTIIGEKHCGGLKIIDFEIMEWSLKIAWIKRIAESSNASWKKSQIKLLTNTEV